MPTPINKKIDFESLIASMTAAMQGNESKGWDDLNVTPQKKNGKETYPTYAIGKFQFTPHIHLDKMKAIVAENKAGSFSKAQQEAFASLPSKKEWNEFRNTWTSKNAKEMESQVRQKLAPLLDTNFQQKYYRQDLAENLPKITELYNAYHKNTNWSLEEFAALVHNRGAEGAGKLLQASLNDPKVLEKPMDSSNQVSANNYVKGFKETIEKSGMKTTSADVLNYDEKTKTIDTSNPEKEREFETYKERFKTINKLTNGSEKSIALKTFYEDVKDQGLTQYWDNYAPEIIKEKNQKYQDFAMGKTAEGKLYNMVQNRQNGFKLGEDKQSFEMQITPAELLELQKAVGKSIGLDEKMIKKGVEPDVYNQNYIKAVEKSQAWKDLGLQVGMTTKVGEGLVEKGWMAIKGDTPEKRKIWNEQTKKWVDEVTPMTRMVVKGTVNQTLGKTAAAFQNLTGEKMMIKGDINAAYITGNGTERAMPVVMHDVAETTQADWDKFKTAKETIAENDRMAKAQAKSDADAKAAQEKANAEVNKQGEEYKASVKEGEDSKRLEAMNKEAESAYERFKAPPELIIPDQFVYDEKGYKKPLPLEAIASGALGLIGMADAKTKLPLRDEQVPESILAYARQVKQASEQGLKPEEEAELKSQMAQMYSEGLNQATKASGGNRNLVLGALDSLNANRMQAVSTIAIADIQKKEANLEKYAKVLEYVSNFDNARKVANHQIKFDEAKEKRTAGAALAVSGFSNMIQELQFQKNNGPGSANHRMQETLLYQLTGINPAIVDNGFGDTPGTASHLAKQKKTAATNYIAAQGKETEQKSYLDKWNLMPKEERLKQENYSIWEANQRKLNMPAIPQASGPSVVDAVNKIITPKPTNYVERLDNSEIGSNIAFSTEQEEKPFWEQQSYWNK